MCDYFLSKVSNEPIENVWVMPQNFRLQKENGIFIKTFYGENQNDNSLVELTPLLSEMAKVSNKDIRESLALFIVEILKKVSSNLSRAI